MDEASELSHLIGDIYDAALDRDLWLSVLKQTCAYVRGACSALIAQDPFANSGQFYFSWGVDPDHERLYLEKYIQLNPAIYVTVATSKVGAVESTATVMQYDEFTASRFYREWAQPQGYCDAVWAILEKSASAAASISILRHDRDGLADDETRGRLRLLAPHFRRAVAIGRVIDLHKVEAAALADTLDGMAAGKLLVDAQSRIVRANSKGTALLDQGNVISAPSGRLATANPGSDSTLREAIAAAVSGDTAVKPEDAGRRWIADVLPLTSGTRRQAGAAYAAVAAVFVREASLDLASPIEAIAELFKLTASESRVLMAIVNIGGVPDVAPVLGISETTVKTHLQRIFDKTGTHRQPDLVKLVAGFTNPLVPPSV
jgi:DNA-binding CsgD family transcriptional regulator